MQSYQWGTAGRVLVIVMQGQLAFAAATRSRGLRAKQLDERFLAGAAQEFEYSLPIVECLQSSPPSPLASSRLQVSWQRLSMIPTISLSMS